MRTNEKVPIIEGHDLGEKGMQVRIEMIKKYTFAALQNYINKLFGAQFNSVYLWS